MLCIACNTEIKEDEPYIKIMNSDQLRVHFKCSAGVPMAGNLDPPEEDSAEILEKDSMDKDKEE